jgi:thiamine kinase-like enzyme
MLPPELELLAGRHVPGAGSIEIHRLRGGLMNDTYRVERDGASFAMRVASPGSSHLGFDRAFEARVLEVAAAADLAPAIAYCDAQRGILITRWALGQRWDRAEVCRPANIARIALLLRRIHSLPLPMPARVMSPAMWLDYYSAAGRTAVQTRHAPALREAAAKHLAAVAALPGVAPVLCHSDLHTLNLIDRGRSLLLLDWEYAHVSDPLWDLAGWSANNDLDEDLKQSLLSSYTGGWPTPDERSRLALLGWLYDYVCLSWSELYLRGAARADAAPDGVAARAAQLAARLQASSRAD